LQDQGSPGQGEPAALSLRQNDVVTTQSLAVQLHRIQDDMESVIEIHKVMYIAHAMLPDLKHISGGCACSGHEWLLKRSSL